MSQVDVNERITLRLDGVLDELHIGLFGGAAAFSGVAPRTGANNICPNQFTAHTSGDNMIERKLTRTKMQTAILTEVAVAGENVPAIELHLVPRQTVIK